MSHHKRNAPLTAKRKQLLEEDAEWIADEYFEPDELIRPEEIAEAEDITYSRGNYNNDFKGLIHYLNGRFHVYLDTTYGNKLIDPIIRYSFAHELGHYFIPEHRDELLAQGLLGTGSPSAMLEDELFEKEAEFFASCLLMPRSRFLADIADQPFSTWLIHQLCRKYKVSQTAALLRYMALGEEQIAVIFTRTNGTFERKIQSPHFRHYNLNLDAEGKIPAGSVAGRYCYERNEDLKTNNLVAADVWFNPKTEEDALRVYKEECLLQKNLNRIVSVVYEKLE
jgi:Zn-dependent peptidase ImmA (M78 family)